MKTKAMMLLVAVATILTLAFPASFASAATETKTITITEAQINASYWVTNPVRRSISNVHVTVENGDVSIAATVTLPRKDPIATVSVWVPKIVAGNVYWVLKSATYNGQRVSNAVRYEINTAFFRIRDFVRDSLRREFKYGPYKVTAVNLTSGLMTIDVTLYRRTPTVAPKTTSTN
jgi:hypothetical protein